MKIIENGSTLQVYANSDIIINDYIPAKYYKISFSKMQGFFLTETNSFTIKEKIYGNHEEKLNKDLCMFTFVDISNMYKLWNISSANTLSTINTVFISYTTFCINRGLVRDCQNHFQEFKRDELNACLNKLIQKILQIIAVNFINLHPLLR